MATTPAINKYFSLEFPNIFYGLFVCVLISFWIFSLFFVFKWIMYTQFHVKLSLELSWFWFFRYLKQIFFFLFLRNSTLFEWTSMIDSVGWLSVEWIKLAWCLRFIYKNFAASIDAQTSLYSRCFVYVYKRVFFVRCFDFIVALRLSFVPATSTILRAIEESQARYEMRNSLFSVCYVLCSNSYPHYNFNMLCS